MAATLGEVLDYINHHMSGTDRTTIVQALNNATKLAEMRATMDLYEGITVEWDSRHGRTIRGTVKKVNRRTVHVQETGAFTMWRVSPNLLRVVPR